MPARLETPWPSFSVEVVGRLEAAVVWWSFRPLLRTSRSSEDLVHQTNQRMVPMDLVGLVAGSLPDPPYHPCRLCLQVVPGMLQTATLLSDPLYYVVL